MRYWTFVLLSALAVTLSLGGTSLAGKPGGGGITNPAIVFSASPKVGKPNQVFLMTANGATTVQITNDGLWHMRPVWSPDGTKIAFAGGTHQTYGIYTVRADGTNTTLHLVLADLGPPYWDNSGLNRIDWSPDGTKIALSGMDGLGIVLLDLASGTTTQVLAQQGDEVAHHWSPSFSPDGTKIAFSKFVYSDPSRTSGDYEGMVLDLTSGAVTNVTNSAAINERQVDWSRDGQFLAVARGDGSLFKMRPDGTGLTQVLGPNPSNYINPSWSSDGAHISVQQGGDIYRVRADGAGLTNTTNTRNRSETYPDWNPAWVNDLGG